MSIRPCADVDDPDLFFRNDKTSIREATRICARCPLREACYQEAVEGDEAGTWGGVSEADRHRRVARRPGAHLEPERTRAA